MGRFQTQKKLLLWKPWGCREALVWIQENGVENVIVESDSLVLVSSIHNASEDSSGVGLIIKDCKTLINSLWNCSTVHVCRSAN